MPPVVCPRPGPHGPGRDCPLWDARERIALQRSIEADGAVRAGMGALVWASMNRDYKRPDSTPTRPVPIEDRPIAALVLDETVTAEPAIEKEVPAHA
jgi:hypothetical protein